MTLDRGRWSEAQIAELKASGVKVKIEGGKADIDIERNNDLSDILQRDVDDAKGGQ